MTERIGIIDLGSNSSRLSIYEIYDNDSYRPVFEMKQNVRLAHDMTEDNRISADGIARAVTCTKLFHHAGTLHGVTHWVPVATAAIRQAANQTRVLSTLETETNLSFRVLTGQEEGRYGYIAVVNSLEFENAVVFDIGGASSEIMLVKDRTLKEVISLPFGSLSLTDRFRDVPEKLVGDEVRAFMRDQFRSVPWLRNVRGVPLIGLGGTARALAKLDLWRQQHKYERIHGYPVSVESLFAAFDHVKPLSLAKRRKIKGLSNSRADIIVPGLATIAALVDTVDATGITISRSGLREGVLFEYLLKDSPSPVVDSVLGYSLANFQKVFHVNKQVAGVVTAAAMRLFDGLQSVHGMDERARKLLYITAQIESCGCYINTEKWTLHSAYLAVGSFLYGPTYPQVLDIANLLMGRGDETLQKLYTLLRLGKLLTLQLGIVPDLILCEVEADTVVVGRAHDIRETVRSSAEAALASVFERMFGARLVYADYE